MIASRFLLKIKYPAQQCGIFYFAEEVGPRLRFSNLTGSVHLADNLSLHSKLCWQGFRIPHALLGAELASTK